MTDSDLRDWRGTPIEIGSTIVYPGRHGSSMWMVEGKVRNIVMINFYAIHTGAKPDYHLIVVPTSQSAYWGSRDDRKAVTIFRTDRVTVVKER